MHTFIPDWAKIAYYRVRGRRPWSRGYSAFKHRYIEEMLHNKQIMERFRKAERLPFKYGYALDERVVEYPWTLSRIPAAENARLLDAGSSLNFKEIVSYTALQNKKMTIVTLYPEQHCFWKDSISYLFADIRKLPFRDNWFDYIICISTLEHVGMDNTIFYTKDAAYREEKRFDFEKALLELRRVVKKGGKLFITVPFGKYQNVGRFQQFDADLLSRVIDVFGPTDYQVSYYRYTKDGWNIADEQSCKDEERFDIRKTKYVDKTSSRGFDADLAPASRAVACIVMIK